PSHSERGGCSPTGAHSRRDRAIRRYTRRGQAAFLMDEKGQDAVLRNFSVIGEAANRLSAETRHAHPEVAWDGAIGLRHVVVHDYFKLDLSRICEVVQRDLPQLDRQVEVLLRGRPG